MKTMKYKTKITLFNSYFDFNNNLKLSSILSIFQDVAAHHAEDIGVGYEPMLKKNLLWVLSRVKFDIVKQPQINETVIVETWPHIKGKIDFDRDFLIKNLNQEVLIKGTSKWCVINSQTRMLSRTDEIEYVGKYYNKINYDEKFVKTPTFDTTNLKPKFSHMVSFSDLDHNGHMNNTMYANLIFDAIENKNVNHFQINFLNECLLNDNIDVYYVKENNQQVCGVVNNKVVFSSLLN